MSKNQIITLKNDFHATEARVQVPLKERVPGHGSHWLPISIGQARRLKRLLCGVQGCTCSDHVFGSRGPQDHVAAEWLASGGVGATV